ncbi:hypothetical protein GQX73_g9353 [Xylaria multiplex]|uniref:Metallo-beta-lactamase domain-containing protein n=1 Tax=Xylaria multiplex TaxID=323545 RepID=A0A7C8MN53_9PEZI|nr:hypothetical protein GQX73_g9353 [Xylaria multiplex]
MSEPIAKKHKGGYRQIIESQLSHLPNIADVEQISSRLIRVLGQNAGKGIPEWTGLISSVLADSNFALSRILLTHWHGDHTGGVPDLPSHSAPSMPFGRLWNPYHHPQSTNTPSKGQRPMMDGQVFKVEGATIRAVHAPGHSQDYMCFVLEEENAIFTGNNVLDHGTATVEQLSSWMESLRTMGSHMVIQNLPRNIEAQLTSKTRREMQIPQVLARLKDANARRRVTVKELVHEMHGNQLGDEVRRMEEVLRKLAEDGSVVLEAL